MSNTTKVSAVLLIATSLITHGGRFLRLSPGGGVRFLGHSSSVRIRPPSTLPTPGTIA